MPEGDTVYYAAARLHAALAGRVLTLADLRVPAHATADLTGREVVGVAARGKHLLARIEGGLTLHTHLRMDGAWRIYPAGARWTGGAGWQIRAVLGNSENTAVGYRLPVVDLLRTEQEAEVVGHLGPDLLGADWDQPEAVRRLSADPGRAIGEALLDQRNLAGIGNVYANELCFLAGVTLWTPVGALAPAALDRIAGLAHRLLTLNKARHGQVTTGDTRPDRRHWVYERARQPCRRCGTRILAAEHGDRPRQRVAYWCPRCQQGPIGASGPVSG